MSTETNLEGVDSRETKTGCLNENKPHGEKRHPVRTDGRGSPSFWPSPVTDAVTHRLLQTPSPRVAWLRAGRRQRNVSNDIMCKKRKRPHSFSIFSGGAFVPYPRLLCSRNVVRSFQTKRSIATGPERQNGILSALGGQTAFTDS